MVGPRGPGKIVLNSQVHISKITYEKLQCVLILYFRKQTEQSLLKVTLF